MLSCAPLACERPVRASGIEKPTTAARLHFIENKRSVQKAWLREREIPGQITGRGDPEAIIGFCAPISTKQRHNQLPVHLLALSLKMQTLSLFEYLYIILGLFVIVLSPLS